MRKSSKPFNFVNARRYMKASVGECVDECGDVNLTELVEDTCAHFGTNHENGPLDDPDHWVWELAVHVRDWYVIRAANADATRQWKEQQK